MRTTLPTYRTPNTCGSRWLQLRQSIPPHVTLVAVSKYHSVDDILSAYNAGCRDFAESRVQELLRKQAELPTDIRWHFIGHLQTNKVRALIPYTTLIHSIDSLRLMQYVQEESVRIGKPTNILLELHVAQEESKSGMEKTEFMHCLNEYLSHSQLYSHIRIQGVMGMATFTQEQDEITRCFNELQRCQQTMQTTLPAFRTPNAPAPILSMGMSDDYHIAIQCGSNMVRIGSAIFGERT